MIKYDWHLRWVRPSVEKGKKYFYLGRGDFFYTVITKVSLELGSVGRLVAQVERRHHAVTEHLYFDIFNRLDMSYEKPVCGKIDKFLQEREEDLEGEILACPYIRDKGDEFIYISVDDYIRDFRDRYDYEGLPKEAMGFTWV